MCIHTKVKVFLDMHDGEHTVEVDGKAYSALAAYSVCECAQVQQAAELAWFLDQRRIKCTFSEECFSAEGDVLCSHS